MPNATSFGQTVYVNGKYVGDVWCYNIDIDNDPNCMISFCIFEPEYWSMGVGTIAVNMFIKNIRARYNVKTIGAFTFSHNYASIRVLEKMDFLFWKNLKKMEFGQSICNTKDEKLQDLEYEIYSLSK